MCAPGCSNFVGCLVFLWVPVGGGGPLVPVPGIPLSVFGGVERVGGGGGRRGGGGGRYLVPDAGSRYACGRCPRGSVNGGGHRLSGCGITSEGEMGRLAMPVVVAREERPLGRAMVCRVAASFVRGRREVSPCRWSLPGRIGQWGRPSFVRLRHHRPKGDGSSRYVGGRCPLTTRGEQGGDTPRVPHGTG